MNLRLVFPLVAAVAFASYSEAGRELSASRHGVMFDVAGTTSKYKVEKPMKVAEKVKLDIEHAAGTPYTKSIPFKGHFVEVHFSHLNLADGDAIRVSTNKQHQVIRSGETAPLLSDRLEGKGEVTIEYTPRGSSHGSKAFVIDYILQKNQKRVAKRQNVCGVKPAWEPAQCYATKGPEHQARYKVAQAVARMSIQGGQGAGTGFLIGCEGWFLTNEHNVETQAAVSDASYEFGAECACGDKKNNESLACNGKYVVKGNAKLHAVHKQLDYSLLQFDKKYWHDLEKFGYMKIRRSGAVLGDEFYMPQHPMAQPRQIVSAMNNGTKTSILSMTLKNECGENQLGYYADSEGGSSGSPVIATADNLVIGLHHCGGCMNAAYSTKEIFDDIEKVLAKSGTAIPKCWYGTEGGNGGDSKKEAANNGRHAPGINLNIGSKSQSRTHVQGIDLHAGAGAPGIDLNQASGGSAKKHASKSHGGQLGSFNSQEISGGAFPPSGESGKKHSRSSGGGSKKSGSKGQLFPVDVCKGATYLVAGIPCSAEGDACPLAYDQPIGGCEDGMVNSPEGCVVPEDALCMQAPNPKTGQVHYKCVFPSVGC
ncbi:hypothetical protein AC1031_012625 [Aphanomyces cochlioides]|nr:hypothetical protein AC1031_012625 [Aphanomyces cochlioides]